MKKLLKCFTCTVLSSLLTLPLFSCSLGNDKVNELEQQNSELANELANKQKELEEKITSQKKEYEDKISNLLDSHSEELAKLNKEISSLNEKYNEDVDKLHKNYSELEELTNNKINRLESKIKEEELSYKKEINSLNSKINALNEKESSIKKEYEAQIDELNLTHQQKISELNDEIKTLTDSQNEIKKGYEEEIDNLKKAHQEELNRLNTQIDNLIQNDGILKEKYESQIKELNETHKVEITKLNEEIINLNKTLEQNNKLLNEQKLSYESQIEELNQTHKEKIDELNNKISSLQDNETALKESYENQITELNEAHKSEVSKLNAKIDELINDMNQSDVGALIQKYEKQIEELNTSHQLQINDLNKEINSLKENEETLKSQYEKEKNDLIESTTKQIEELNQKITSLQENEATLKTTYENQIKELNETHTQELTVLNQKVIDLNTEITSLKEANQKEIEVLNKKHTQEKLELNTQINQLNKDLATEKANHDKEIENLNKTHSEELKTLTDELANINNTHKAELNNLKAQYENQIKDLESENQSLKDRITELEGGEPTPGFNAASIVANDLLSKYQDQTVRTEDFTLPTYTIMKDDVNNHVVVDIKWSLEVKTGGVDGAIVMGEINKDENIPFTVKYNYLDSVKPTNFTLHCNLLDTNHNRKSFDLNYVVPKFEYTNFDQFKALLNKKDEAVVQGQVTAIYNNGIYIEDNEGYGYLAYKPALKSGQNKENYLKEYPLGSKVVVNGKVTQFNKQYEFASGCSVTLVEAPSVDYKLDFFDATEIFGSATVESYTQTLEMYQSRAVSLNNITMLTPSKDSYPFKVGNSNVIYYMDIHDILNSLTSSEATNMLSSWTEGYVANINGIVKVFNDKYEIIPVSKDSIKITSTELPNDVKVNNALDNISSLFELAIKDEQIVLPTVTDDGVRLTYEVIDGTSITLQGDKLIITRQEAQSINTLKVTAEIADVKVSKEIKVTVSALASKYISVSDALSVPVNSEVTVRGTVKQVKGDKVTITDGIKDMVVYKSTTKNFEVGQEVLVTGTIKEYNNENQITTGSVAQIISYKGMTLIEDAKLAKDGTEVSILGKVKSINTEWNGTNMSITLVDGFGKQININNMLTKVSLDQEIVIVGKTLKGEITDGAVSKSLEEWKKDNGTNPDPDPDPNPDPQEPTTPDLTGAIVGKYTGTTDNMELPNNASLIGLDDTVWDVISDKNDQTNHVGLNVDGTIRIYKAKNTEGNILTISNKVTTIDKVYIELDLKNKGKMKIEVNGQEVAPNDDGTYTIKASSFSIYNVSPANTKDQLWIKTINLFPTKK